MAFCPYLSGIALKEEDVTKEDGSVEKKRVYEIIEIECQKEKCEFFDNESGRCTVLSLSDIIPIKKALQNISINLHDDLYNIQHETSQKLVDLGGKIENIKETVDNVGIDLEPLYKKMDQITEAVGNLQVNLEPLTEGINSIVEEKILPSIKSTESTFSQIGNRITESVSSMKEDAINVIERTTAELKERLGEKFDSLKEAFSSIEDSIKNIPQILETPLRDVKEEMKTPIVEIGSDVKKLIELFDVLMNRLPEETQRLKDTLFVTLENMEKVVQQIAEKLDYTSGSLQDGMSGIKDGFNGFSTLLESMTAKMEEFSTRASEYIQEVREKLKALEEKEREEEGKRLNDEGVLEYYSGNIQTAIEKFRKAIELLGERKEILINLAMALSKNNENEEAREVLDKILSSSPEDVDAILSMGVISFNKGEEEEALSMMEKARSKEENPVVIANLGFVYEKMGKIDRAIEMWEKALEMDNSLMEVEEAINRYKERRI